MFIRLLSVAAAATAIAGAAAAQAPLSAPELDAHRGGFLVAGDVAFEFGAVVRSFEDGQLLLQTQVTWTPTGPIVNRLAAGGDGAALQSVAGPGSTLVSPSGATLSQVLKGGELTNILINSESGRSFRQETDVTLVLPGFASSQAEIGRSLTGLRLADDMANGAIAAVR